MSESKEPEETEDPFEEIVFVLSDYVHQMWSRWMSHMFSKSTLNPDGTVTIPKDLVIRWQRQMLTDFVDLPDEEMESDIVEAETMLDIVLEGLEGFPDE